MLYAKLGKIVNIYLLNEYKYTQYFVIRKYYDIDNTLESFIDNNYAWFKVKYVTPDLLSDSIFVYDVNINEDNDEYDECKVSVPLYINGIISDYGVTDNKIKKFEKFQENISLYINITDEDTDDEDSKNN